MNRYRLTRDAERDLLDIFLYGFEAVGRAKALAYRDDLATCFDLLATPRLGRKANLLGPSTRRHEHGSPVIFYEEADDASSSPPSSTAAASGTWKCEQQTSSSATSSPAVVPCRAHSSPGRVPLGWEP